MNRPASAMGSSLGRGVARAYPSAAERARDDQLLHLVGALADREDLGVAVEAAHRVLLDVAVAAVNLHRLLGRAHREAPGLQLRLSGRERVVPALVLLDRRPVGEEA